MGKRIYIHKIGSNTTVVDTAGSKRYLYEYSRTVLEEGEENAPTRTTFSDDLGELIKLKEKETSEYEKIEPKTFSWEKRNIDAFEYPKFIIYKVLIPETKSIAGGFGYKVLDK